MTKPEEDSGGDGDPAAGGSPARRRPAAARNERCAWCRRVLPGQRTGRPRQYCSQACRQWHWVGRQRASELRLREDELIIARSELDALRDELFVLACAVDDTERDLAARGEPTARETRELLEWLLGAARPLRDREFRRGEAST